MSPERNPSVIWQWWDKILIANLFFLFLCFFWFVTLVVAYNGFHTDLGWELWVKAWTWIVNPSLGMFFLGVIISWLRSKLQSSK